MPHVSRIASSESSVPVEATPSAETVLLAWRVHRLCEEPERIPLLTLAYAGVATLGWLVFAHLAAVLLLLLILTGSLVEFLLPISYRLTTLGAYASCGPSQLFLAWRDVRRATRGKDGIYLSPFAKPSRLDGFRGVRLRCLPENADMVRDMVCRLWKEPHHV